MEKQTFLIVSKTGDPTAVEVIEADDLDELNFLLGDLTFSNPDPDENASYHGFLFSARMLPTNFDGFAPYVIVRNPERHKSSVLKDDALMIKSERSIDDLERIIGNAVTKDSDDTSVFGSKVVPVTIEDIFVFVGRPLQPVLQITEEYVFDDEEYLERLGTMEDRVSKLTTRSK